MDKIKILIAEDSKTQAMELQYILEKEGYSVLTAQNGIEALALIGQSKPAIVISDIIMPKMDGYVLCRQIKEDKSLKDILVMLLTSLSEPQDVIRSLQCGADKFCTKPYDEEHLLLTVKNLLLANDPFEVRENKNHVEVLYGGQSYTITSDRKQIINLLISTYEAAILKNNQLIKTQDELQVLNKNLEEMVEERTAELQEKNDELKLILQQLLQAEKLATMGELSASIAHELNNPLATVNLRVESLLAQVPPEDPKRPALEVIEQELDRMANLVANLLQFSRRSQQQISTVDVCQEINNTLDLILYHLRKNGIQVQREFSPDIPYVHADRQQLRQLFLNLFTNSSDAMPQGGTLTIRVFTQESEAEGQRLEVRDQKTKVMSNAERRTMNDERIGPAFMVVEIADTGIGIAPDVLHKVMEPFFTTKPEGKGTGLGLPICRRIVQEHNGTFDITSEGVPGKGITVHIALPVKNVMNVIKL